MMRRRRARSFVEWDDIAAKTLGLSSGVRPKKRNWPIRSVRLFVMGVPDTHHRRPD